MTKKVEKEGKGVYKRRVQFAFSAARVDDSGRKPRLISFSTAHVDDSEYVPRLIIFDNYYGEVVFGVETLTDDGVVANLGELRELVDSVVAVLDHTSLDGSIVPYPSTCEVLARWIYSAVQESLEERTFPKDVKLIEVTLWEAEGGVTYAQPAEGS